jgi:Putative DMAP1-like
MENRGPSITENEFSCGEKRGEGEGSESERDGLDEEEYFYQPHDEEAVEYLCSLVEEHKNIYARREQIINRHFGELNINAEIDEQERQLLINEYINKDLVYPSVFLGSTLGFNKNNWNRNIEKLLEPFGLRQKPVFGVKENCLLFEKLKLLILRLMERTKK